MDSNLELQWKKSLVSLPFFYYLPGKERTETGLFSSCAWLGCSRNMNQRQKLLAQFIRPGIANGRWWRGRRELILSGTAQTSKCFTVGGREGGSDAVVVGVEVDEETLKNLNRLEGYYPGEKSTFYDRIEIDTPWGKAFTYIYVNELSKDSIVESGDWVSYKNEEKSWSSVTNN